MEQMDYMTFLVQKQQSARPEGIKRIRLPDMMFDFQRHLTEWALTQGRSAIFADCGMGKSLMLMAWAENVVRETNKPVLVVTPLAVTAQIIREAEKFGIEAHRSNDGKPSGDITVTNYEKLDKFDWKDYSGVVCDESSRIKCADAATRQLVTAFTRKVPYRLLCTATAAPNDYIEVGTSSEALGELERKHMLAQFFTHDGGNTASWVLKGHARTHLYWRWVCSWARAMRKPSDLGFDDGAFRLPPLDVRQHTVKAATARDGYLFDIPAVGLAEQRADLRRTIGERCGMAAQLVNAHDRPAVVWCNLNDEGKRLAREINGAAEVAGADSEERKEEVFKGFITGQIRVLVTKPQIGGFGLNLQHCAHQTYFPSHSYEQYYQCVRRCWRFGQKSPVTVDLITTDGQDNVLANLNRKAEQADAMFNNLVSMMWRELRIERKNQYTQKEQVPSWL